MDRLHPGTGEICGPGDLGGGHLHGGYQFSDLGSLRSLHGNLRVSPVPVRNRDAFPGKVFCGQLRGQWPHCGNPGGL